MKGKCRTQIVETLDFDPASGPARLKSGAAYRLVIKSAKVNVDLNLTPLVTEMPRFQIILSSRSRNYSTKFESGVAAFDFIQPGKYSVSIKPIDIDLDYLELADIPPVYLRCGDEKSISIAAHLFSHLKVRVVSSITGETIDQSMLTLNATGRELSQPQEGDDWTTFRRLIPGNYELTAQLPTSLRDTYLPPVPQYVQVPPAMTREIIIEAEKNLRVLQWNISDLGGGLTRAEKRPEFCIESYATVIDALETDLCILMGIRDCGHQSTNVEFDSDGNYYYVSVSPVQGTGISEVGRILKSLQDINPSGGWKSEFLRFEEDDSIVYQAGCTTCMIYRSADKLNLCSTKYVKAPSDANLGISGDMILAEFERVTNAGVAKFSIAAPLTTFHSHNRTSEKATDIADLSAGEKLPESCLLALSSKRNIRSRWRDTAIRYKSSTIDLPQEYGDVSVPARPIWETISYASPQLIGDLHPVAWHDPLAIDQMMYWDALATPEHPKDPKSVEGSLSDVILARGRGSVSSPRLISAQVVNMIEASMEGGTAADSPVAGSLKRYKQEYMKGEVTLEDSESADSKEAIMEQCRSFSSMLSDHWPVLATFRIPARQST